MNIRSLLFLVCCVVYATARRTDDRWLKQPQLHTRLMEGQIISFTYKYARPPSSPRRGKLFFGRRTPADGPETNLMEADVDPDTGDMTVVYTREHNKVNITHYKQGFDITVYNMSHSESGLYLTDLNFDLDASLHDSFTVTIFRNPTFKHAPHAVLQPKTSSNVTLKWQLRHHPDLPKVTNLTVIYSKNLQRDLYSTTLISHTMDTQTEQWQLIYPDKEKQFVDRISYATDSKHELIELTLWDLRRNDSGEYQLVVGFESNLTRLENQTTLHVMSDYKWLRSPRDTESVVESRDLTLNFRADLNESGIRDHFELVRITNDSSEHPVLHILYTQSGLRTHISPDNIGRWSTTYDIVTGSVSVTLISAVASDGGQYIGRIKGPTGYILSYRNFNIETIEEYDLHPVIESNTSLDPDRKIILVHFNHSRHPDRAEILDDKDHVTSLMQSEGMKTVQFVVPDTVRLLRVKAVFSDLNHSITDTIEFPEQPSVNVAPPVGSDSTFPVLILVSVHLATFVLWIFVWIFLRRKRRHSQCGSQPEQRQEKAPLNGP